MRADILRALVAGVTFFVLGGMSLSVRNAYGQDSSGSGGCLALPSIPKAPDSKTDSKPTGKGGGGKTESEEEETEPDPNNPNSPTGQQTSPMVGFEDTGPPTPERSARNAFASMAQHLPPTRASMEYIAQTLGPGVGHLDSSGNYIFNGDNGGYVSIEGKGNGASWQWHPNDAAHPSAGGAVEFPPSSPRSGRSSDPRHPPLTCYPPPPPLSRIGLKIHSTNGEVSVVDATPQTSSHHGTYCQTVMGDPNRGDCPMRPEGDPMRGICEALVMGPGPVWSFFGAGGILGHPGDNPYLCKVRGVGTVRACSPISGVCNTIRVPNDKAVAPAAATPAGGGGGPVGGGNATRPTTPTSPQGMPTAPAGSGPGVPGSPDYAPSTSTSPAQGEAPPALIQ